MSGEGRVLMMRELVVIFGIGAAALLCGDARGCAWDSDTLADELATKNGTTIYDLLVGQVPHHGEVYYRARISRLEPLVESGKATRAERNDLAVALMRVGEFDRSGDLMKGNLESRPGEYETLSNLGVLAKKRGDYVEAVGWIEKALAIKPEGHMGLGDWYVKMLRYRARVEASGEKPEVNFLGEPLEAAFDPSLEDNRWSEEKMKELFEGSERFQKLSNLLRNDQSFADGFLAMGDYLARVGNLHLAFVAYSRAIEIGHANTSAIKARRRKLLRHWEAAMHRRFRGNSKRLAWWDEEVALAAGRVKAGAAWLEKFQEAEGRLVAKRGDVVGFVEVEKALEETGVKRSGL